MTVHGTDVAHPRTRLATAPVLGADADRRGGLGRRSCRSFPAPARAPARSCSPAASTWPLRALARARRRARTLGLEQDRRYLLFPADPARPEKRYDLALALARAAGVELLTLGHVAPEEVPLWVNAADAVVVPSEREGFGLAVLEALACDVPVLATPVGIHAEALAGIAGALCEPFSLERWSEALAATLADRGPPRAGSLARPRLLERRDGRARARRLAAGARATALTAAG